MRCKFCNKFLLGNKKDKPICFKCAIERGMISLNQAYELSKLNKILENKTRELFGDDRMIKENEKTKT